jgi:hypothetical protein
VGSIPIHPRHFAAHDSQDDSQNPQTVFGTVYGLLAVLVRAYLCGGRGETWIATDKGVRHIAISARHEHFLGEDWESRDFEHEVVAVRIRRAEIGW